jgi:N-acyl-D-amino-acid deacylase
MAEYDVLIRGGTIVDGSGGEPFRGDVAIRDRSIAAVGKVAGTGREEIDARGSIVTPGFVDIHTHYDGQVTWGERLTPSSVHGVTSVVMGNCGVGFAPCRPADHDALIRLMEGVEDIPGIVMTAGIPWNWETFPQYLDALAQRAADVDFAAQVPHSPVRLYVMGARGAAREPATSADIAAMAAVVRDGVAAGALGFSTSRTVLHRTKGGALTPTATAGEEELRGIARALGDLGQGVLQMIDDFQDAVEDQATEFEMWRRIVAESGRPLSFNLTQRPGIPDKFRYLLAFLSDANRAGLQMRGQVCGRPIGLLFGLDASFNPFSGCPTYHRLAALPLAERVAEMRRPATRAAILSEIEDLPAVTPSVPFPIGIKQLESLYELNDPPDYSPLPETSLAARARALGIPGKELVYDTLLGRDGQAIIYFPTSNFVNGNLDATYEMMQHDHTVLGIADGGAHVGIICDASAPTHVLSYWTRDRDGDRLSLPQAVRMLAHDTAETVGLGDRGLLQPGYKADLNVIDYDRLQLHPPRIVFDLPGGGRRLVQDADGYVATLVSGTITYRDGSPTGALPGRLIRGAQRPVQMKSAGLSGPLNSL